MFDRTGRQAIGRVDAGSRGLSKAGRRLRLEPLEGRSLMTASLAPIAAVTSPQYQGYQVPLIGGTTHAQTFTVTSSNSQVRATVAQGQFLTIGVTHASSGAGDPAFTGTMTFQLFQDLTPNTVAKISALVNGTTTAPNTTGPTPTSTGPNTLSTAATAFAGKNYYVPSPANAATPPRVFHRVANGFPDANSYIVQGGSLNGTGSGQVFLNPFPDEFVQQIAFTGTGQLAMANAGSDTNDSQFFITTGSPTFLNYNHTIFGQIVAGQNILAETTQVAKKADTSGAVTVPVDPITFTQASLSSTSPDGVVHIDTTQAPAGATSTVTVTATDVTDGTTTTQSFPVTVSAFDVTNPSRPFLGPYDPTINIGRNQTLRLQLTAVATPPSDPVTYTVQGGVTTSATTGVTSFTPVTNGTATVSSTGLVTLTPTAGYSGPISLLVGVRDNVNRANTSSIDTPGNYKSHIITVNVAATATPVAIRPIASPQTVSVPTIGGTTIQLAGTNPNTTATAPLTYALVTQPAHGTVSNFNAATGSLTYTPAAGFLGADALQYTVTDPTSGLTSFVGTASINVSLASTGAVRFFADNLTTSTTTPGVLVVTPLPRTDGGTNTINVTQSNGNIVVNVNGVTDILQPTVANTDSIVVYGSKANDNITIDPGVTNPVTLSGGTFGTNTLRAGGGPATEQGWYGKNTLIQGSSRNFQYGRAGHVTFVKGTGTSDIIFAGTPGHFNGPRKVRILPSLPTGTFYTFSGQRLIKTTNPFIAQNRALVGTSQRTGNTTASTSSAPTGSTGSISSGGTNSGTGAGTNSPGTVQTAALHATQAPHAAKAHQAATRK